MLLTLSLVFVPSSTALVKQVSSLLDKSLNIGGEPEQFAIDRLKCLVCYALRVITNHYMCHIPSVLPTWIAIALLFLSLLALYCSLRRLSLSSLFLTLSILTWQCNEQYFLCCKSSVAWLTVQTIFGESVMFSVNPPWHG